MRTNSRDPYQVALVVCESHTGLVSLPVPVVGHTKQYTLHVLMHVPVVSLVFVSRARVVVGTHPYVLWL